LAAQPFPLSLEPDRLLHGYCIQAKLSARDEACRSTSG
jgi:hypothetical protein